MARNGKKRNLSCRVYEILNDPQLQDFLTLEGFLEALIYCKQLRPLSMNHWGIPCSSWVYTLVALPPELIVLKRFQGSVIFGHDLYRGITATV